MTEHDEEYLRRLRERLAEVAAGRELEALARGKPVPASVPEIRSLIAQQTSWEARASSAPTPSPATSDYWDDMVARVNELRRRLDDKPRDRRIGYQATPGSVLNAYREGDLSFDEAVEVLRGLPAAGLTAPERRELLDVLASSERYDPEGDEPDERALQGGLRKGLGLPAKGGA